MDGIMVPLSNPLGFKQHPEAIFSEHAGVKKAWLQKSENLRQRLCWLEVMYKDIQRPIKRQAWKYYENSAGMYVELVLQVFVFIFEVFLVCFCL